MLDLLDLKIRRLVLQVWKLFLKIIVTSMLVCKSVLQESDRLGGIVGAVSSN